MSIELFKESYRNSDIVQLRKFIKKPKVISTKKFMEYVEESFMANRPVYDILVLILFNQYDLNEAITYIINRDNVDLLENILSNKYEVKLDENLILLTVPKGRISMAKAIYEYIHDDNYPYPYEVVTDLLEKHDFVFNKDEKSIDSFVIGLHKELTNLNGGDRQLEKRSSRIKNIIPYIDPGLWDDFAIKYAVEVMDYSVIENLLLHPNVDPGADNNYSIETAIDINEDYYTANELLKHPMVPVDYNIASEFIEYVILYNCLCVAEKILRLGDDDTVAMFKRQSMIDLMIECLNDITYLAIKLGIFGVSKLINAHPEQRVEIKKYLKEFKIDATYIPKPYDLNLDPDEILKLAFEEDDVDLAKSIKNYPVSIHGCYLMGLLDKYTNHVSKYIYNKVLVEYNQYEILIGVSKLYHELFDKVFDIIADWHALDYEYLYDNCHNNGDVNDIILAHIEDNYSKKKYKKFCEDRAIVVVR